MRTFISCHMGPTQKLELAFIRPTPKNISSFSWVILDILLFSWYMLYGRKRSQTLCLHLDVPWELWDDEDDEVWDSEPAGKGIPKVQEKPFWLHFLFPLNMACGRGIWLGHYEQEQSLYLFILISEFRHGLTPNIGRSDFEGFSDSDSIETSSVCSDASSLY